MRTHNIALVTVVFLVVGGLLSGLMMQKPGQQPGLVEERATSAGSGGFASSASFVQTAQGANLDASQIAMAAMMDQVVNNAAFSSLDGVYGLADATLASPIAYPSGAVADPDFYPSFNR